MNLDPLMLYKLMFQSRTIEETISKLWQEGQISGEMHMGIGEEGIIAGVVSSLIEGDVIATDHRSTAPFIMRGVDPKLVLLELLGHPEGLCGGLGGHMHLFSKEKLILSSGIVGASGPAAVGFALAIKYKKQKNIAVSFFGEGSMNQGMLLESFNLASVLKLPVLFVCKDNDLAITTRSSEVTGGTLIERAKGLGVEGVIINGMDVKEVGNTCHTTIQRMREKNSPYFIHATCEHHEGHFLGDPLLRFQRSPLKEFKEVTKPLMKSTISPSGARLDKRIRSIGGVLSLIANSRYQMKDRFDPLIILRKELIKQYKDEIMQIEAELKKEVELLHSSVIQISEVRKSYN